MIGGAILLKKKYSFFEILSVAFMIIGLIGISLSDRKSTNEFDTIGVICAILSLICDAIYSNYQEKALSWYHASQSELISMMYLIGTLILLVISLVTFDFFTGIQCCKDDPSVIPEILGFSVLGAIGLQFISILMICFGSLLTVIVTSLRKGFTFFLSYLLFPGKKFTIYHLLSMVLISGGIGLNFFAQQEKKKKEISKKIK